eukprot:PITA_15843
MALRTWWEFSAVGDEEEPKTRKGPWTVQEDMQLIRYINSHGEGRWPFLAKAAGLNRTGKSCRLRWINYLRPDLKRSKITPQEERLIIKLHRRWGNRWSRIAQNLSGRTDNEIKNYWRTRIKKRLNLQAESGSSSMDADSGVQIAGSKASDFLATSSQRLPDLDSPESSTSITWQTTEEIAVQPKEMPYLQSDSSPRSREDCENGLQGEIREGSHQINDDEQQGAALQGHLEGSEELFENAGLPYIFSVGSLATLLSSDLFADDGFTQDFSYMAPSPDIFAESESYLNGYSDVLWNVLD